MLRGNILQINTPLLKEKLTKNKSLLTSLNSFVSKWGHVWGLGGYQMEVTRSLGLNITSGMSCSSSISVLLPFRVKDHLLIRMTADC